MFERKERVVVKHQIVEVEKPRPQVREDVEAQKAVSTLQHHIGFQFLMEKLRLQRALLERHLQTNRHKDIRDVEFIQSGIAWTKWLEAQVSQAVQSATAPQGAPATPEEQAAFEAIQAVLEHVGEEG